MQILQEQISVHVGKACTPALNKAENLYSRTYHGHPAIPIQFAFAEPDRHIH
jgi:hypothetical protein